MAIDMVARAYVFQGVFVYRATDVVVRGVFTQLDEEAIPHAFLLRFRNGKWSHYTVGCDVADHCVIQEGTDGCALCLCFDGKIHRNTFSHMSWEYVDETELGPSALRRMHRLRRIGSSVYAVGMDRQIYRRYKRTWTKFNTGIDRSAGDPIDIGFRDIGGTSETSMYAVGFHGDIWYYDGDVWCRVNSPSNLRLENVLSVADDHVYISGEHGVILVGGRNRWSVLEHHRTHRDFWSMAEYNNRVYLCDGQNIFNIVDGILEVVADPALLDRTVSYLHSADGVMWSVGENDMLVYDGLRWTYVDTPLRK